MGGEENPEPLRLRRLRFPLRVVGFVVVVLALVTGSFIAGAHLAAPQAEDSDNANRHIPVTAAVERRVVTEETRMVAQYRAGTTVPITVTEASVVAAAPTPTSTSEHPGTSAGPSPSTPPQAEATVVSAVTQPPQSTVTYGSLLGEVSGRPVFAAPSSFPLYRDLTVGAQGGDVRALQRLLADRGYTGFRVDGTLGVSTIAAAGRFYRAAGYALPAVSTGATGIPWREFSHLPRPSMTVVAAAAAGAVLGSDTPLLTLKDQDDRIVAVATVDQADRLRVGEDMSISVGGDAPATGKILSIGTFHEEDKGRAAGKDITLGVPDSLRSAIVGAATLQVATVNTATPTLAIPLVGVHQDSRGAYVLIPGTAPKDNSHADAAAQDRRVDVTISGQGGGWVALKDNADLPEGTEILVTP